MSDKPAESARPKVPTVEDTLRTLRKISHCSGDPAKLILMRNFAEAYADSLRAELDRSKPAESARTQTEFEHQLRTHKFERDHQSGVPPCKLPANICDQIMELYRALHPEGEKP